MLKLDLRALFGAIAALVVASAAHAADFTVCKSTYALCTTAECSPVPGRDDEVSCACEVRTGYSAGKTSCQKLKKTAAGTEVQSRYFPVKSLSICNNDRPWANCLDKPCVVDAKDPSRAKCACTTQRNLGPYVIVGDTYTSSTCTTGIISSAPVSGNREITQFLETTNVLKPFKITVLNPSQTEGSSEPTSGKMPE